MNGRVYDPTIARFLSADPFIQAPSNLQSYNRYSYVMNNPLRYTDPSGFFWKKLKNSIKKRWLRIRGVIKVVAAAVSGVFCAGGNKLGCSAMVAFGESARNDFHNYNRQKKGLPPDRSSADGVSLSYNMPFDPVLSGVQSNSQRAPSVGGEAVSAFDGATACRKCAGAPSSFGNDFYVSPPYWLKSYPQSDGQNRVWDNPLHVDLDTIITHITTWGGLSIEQAFIWGATVNTATHTLVGKLGSISGLPQQISNWLSSGAGAAAVGGTQTLFTMEKRYITTTATVADWHGDVYYEAFGQVKAIDFHRLSNRRVGTLQVAEQVRWVIGGNVAYTAPPIVHFHSKALDSDNGFPNYDVIYR